VDLPCQGITCNDPPPPSCEDSITLRVYSSTGVCEPVGDVPVCNYSHTDMTCADSCDSSMCTENLCAAVVCDDPPARYCEGDSVVLFNTIGQCSEGECTYASQTVACGSGCAEGHCVGDDPCTSVVCANPPAAFCLTAEILRSFAAPGLCAEGACTYPPIDTTCTDGCSAGQCVGDPCEGVLCTTPPAPYCSDELTLVHWDVTAECSEGICQYGMVDTVCGDGCFEGLCFNPCEAMICMTPPADHCAGNTAITFEAPGSCVGDGFCEYPIMETECPGGCADAECIIWPCMGEGGVCELIVDDCITCGDGYAPKADFGSDGESGCWEDTYCCLPFTADDLYCEQNDGICIPAGTYPATACPPGWTNGDSQECCPGTEFCTGVQCCYPC
jgi:hypothetical protein